MPKRDKKDKRKRGAFLSIPLEDEENCSVTSDVSDSTCHNSEEETTVIEDDTYEKKVKDAMDLATEKSLQTRTNALISLKTALQKRVLTTFLLDNYQTLSDLIERSLKKGRGLEQVSAAKLASVLTVSLISTEESEQVYKILSPVLITVVQDPTLSPQARQEAASTLALMVFLASPEPADLPATLNILHNAFCSALPKGNGELPNHSASVISFHSAALQGVCLLLTLMSNSTVYTMAPKLLEELKPVLKSPDLDLRITIGEAVAVIYESSREHMETFRWKNQHELLNQLEEMMNESHKYMAKKDRKAQRSSFREIIQSIKEGEPFSENVLIGPSNFQQELVLSNWALRFQYQALCHSLEQGLNIHMMSNVPLRDFFDLGPPPDSEMLKGRLNRGPKRPNRQTPEVKARVMARSKNRDNRAAALSYED